jgi:PTS system nitrogen regulatory IIA component
MQLRVRDVCQLLGVSESTLTRWIKQRGLPAQSVGGQYRFHRAELLEWATANQVDVSLEMFDHLQTEEEPVPSLAQALEVGGIFHQVPDTNKDRALRALVQLLPLPEGIDREVLLRLFLAREAAASTAVGDGIALPHVRNPMVLHVDRPLVTLCFLERPVDFGALDGKPVQVLFSLICPTMRSHLQLLARISHALHDKRFKDALLRKAAAEEVLQEARRVEAALTGRNNGAAGGGAAKAAR